MGKIVLEIDEHQEAFTRYQVVDKETILIGRGFDNDIIVKDVFVDARQAVLKVTDSGWQCEDSGSLNGTFIVSAQDPLAQVRLETARVIRSGDTIIIGKSAIRVWDSRHPVAPPQVLKVSNQPDSLASRTLVRRAVFILAAFFVFYYFIISLSWPKVKTSFFQVVIIETALLFCLAIWSGFWAVITRFSKNRHRFLQHLVFSCQYVIILTAAGHVLSVLGFFVCSRMFNIVSALVLCAAAGIYILRSHMAISTNMPALKRTVISSVIIAPVLFILVLSYYSTRNEFDPTPDHFVNLQAVPKKIIPAVSIGKTLERIDSVFQ